MIYLLDLSKSKLALLLQFPYKSENKITHNFVDENDV